MEMLVGTCSLNDDPGGRVTLPSQDRGPFQGDLSAPPHDPGDGRSAPPPTGPMSMWTLCWDPLWTPVAGPGTASTVRRLARIKSLFSKPAFPVPGLAALAPTRPT